MPSIARRINIWAIQRRFLFNVDLERSATEATVIVLTIGHSTRSLEDFTELLQMNHVAELVDVRTAPRSWRNPQFNAEALPAALDEAGIRYAHIAGLGGLRRERPDSANTAWRNASFRGFADYMQSREFEDSLNCLDWPGEGETKRGDVRRGVTLALPPVSHFRRVDCPWSESRTYYQPDQCAPHMMTPFAMVVGSKVMYDGSQ